MKNTGNKPGPCAGDNDPVNKSFDALGTDAFFVRRLAVRGITVPTAVQELVMPKIFAGEELIFSSATGTGKTFAYLIPLLQRFALNRRETGPPGIIVAAPTYELCSQIKGEADFLLEGINQVPDLADPDPAASGPAASGLSEGSDLAGSAPMVPEGAGRAVVKAAGTFPPVRAGLCIGSANISRQVETLKKEKPFLVIGNPGRLLQLARMGKLSLRGLKALVFDEGDRLAAKELFEETGEFAGLAREQGGPSLRCYACSATMPERAKSRLLPFFGPEAGTAKEPGREVLRDSIEHWVLFSEERKKTRTLVSFLAAVKPRKALVFIDAGGRIGRVAGLLQNHKISAGCLYGGMDKQARRNALDDFRKDRIKVLVTSDLAARGLDIPGVSHIVALDMGTGEESYIHRAGRTARSGKRGVMVTIGDEAELRRLQALEKKLGIVIYPKALYQGRLERAGDI
ncbi:MAG: DEAD/DEAH box helicase [Spirochaetaceae bacterium]|jgi:superfamily II DNA/RNA helicase|nr:DEAD/DEAH box helicase [Spirochaetaceae bacterium]